MSCKMFSRSTDIPSWNTGWSSQGSIRKTVTRSPLSQKNSSEVPLPRLLCCFVVGRKGPYYQKGERGPDGVSFFRRSRPPIVRPTPAQATVSVVSVLLTLEPYPLWCRARALSPASLKAPRMQFPTSPDAPRLLPVPSSPTTHDIHLTYLPALYNIPYTSQGSKSAAGSGFSTRSTLF